MKHLVHGAQDQDRPLRSLTIADYLNPMQGAMAGFAARGGRQP
jgi:hypothetical protein